MGEYLIKTNYGVHDCNTIEKLKMYILCLSELGIECEAYKKIDNLYKKIAPQFIEFTKEYCKDER